MLANTSPTPSLLRPAIICYADILGFKSNIKRAFKSGEQETFLSMIKGSLDRAYAMVHQAAKPGNLDTEIFGIKVFSDNIVVAYPRRDPEDDDGEGELGTLLLLFAYVQASLASDGVLLRGAITAGEHYQDNNIVYGKAFLDAVKLDESGSAPRLVIGPTVEALVSQHLESYAPGSAPYHDELLRDPDDGKWFINYLLAAYEDFPDEPIDYELLEKHASHVSKGLHEHGPETSVGDKFEWIAAYHNHVCHTLSGKYQMPVDVENDSDDLEIWLEAQNVLKYLVPLNGRDTKQPPLPFSEAHFAVTAVQTVE